MACTQGRPPDEMQYVRNDSIEKQPHCPVAPQIDHTLQRTSTPTSEPQLRLRWRRQGSGCMLSQPQTCRVSHPMCSRRHLCCRPLASLLIRPRRVRPRSASGMYRASAHAAVLDPLLHLGSSTQGASGILHLAGSHLNRPNVRSPPAGACHHQVEHFRRQQQPPLSGNTAVGRVCTDEPPAAAVPSGLAHIRQQLPQPWRRRWPGWQAIPERWRRSPSPAASAPNPAAVTRSWPAAAGSSCEDGCPAGCCPDYPDRRGGSGRIGC